MKKLVSTLLLTLLLAATINSESLWTDEAFSAFMASQRSVATFWNTLITGDSSDLQMALYYLYLHAWSILFGQSEIAFRTANLPFILLYSGVLVWASHRLFHSRWVWMIAALSPLAVSFSNDSRPYFDVIALSLTCVACLLAYLRSPSNRESKVLPWIILLTLLVGAMFHMLMLLLGPPLIVLLSVFYISNKKAFRWLDWKRPLLILAPAGLFLGAYFAWTFARGTAYNYAKPDLLSIASVLFRFAGLSGYAPNRRYDIPFHPFLFAMAFSTAAFVVGLAVLLLADARSDDKITFRALACALLTALIQICFLSFVVHQQIEFRHLSSLLPLLLLLIMAGLSARNARQYSNWAAILLGVTWLLSDIRLLVGPDYKREDYRSAVRKSIELQQATHAEIAIITDPVAPAYYGLDVKGSQPCFPLTDSCQEGFAKVSWAKRVPAQYALLWSASQITAWLESHERSKTPVVLLISRSRHPMLKDSPWWPLIQNRTGGHLYPQRGFFVYLFLMTHN